MIYMASVGCCGPVSIFLDRDKSVDMINAMQQYQGSRWTALLGAGYTDLSSRATLATSLSSHNTPHHNVHHNVRSKHYHNHNVCRHPN